MEKKIRDTIFFQINALGLVKFYDFRGGVYWRGALIRERCLSKRNRILTIGSFFSQCSYITIQYLWHYLPNRWGLWDYCLFASSVLLFVISKGLLLRYSAFDSRFCCLFNMPKPSAQDSPSLKQWIKWSLLASAFKSNPQLLNELMTRFFSSQFKDSKIHSATNCREAGFIYPASVYWCTPEANYSW